MQGGEVARSLVLFVAMLIPLVGSGSPPAAAAKVPPSYAPAWPKGGGGYQQAGGEGEGHNWGVGGGGDDGSWGISEGGKQPEMGGLRGGQPQGWDGELVGHVGQVTKLVEDSTRHFAVVDGKMYLPLGEGKCEKPNGMQVAMGDWVRVDARPVEGRSNPYICTRLGPAFPPSYPQSPPQQPGPQGEGGAAATAGGQGQWGPPPGRGGRAYPPPNEAPHPHGSGPQGGNQGWGSAPPAMQYPAPGPNGYYSGEHGAGGGHYHGGRAGEEYIRAGGGYGGSEGRNGYQHQQQQQQHYMPENGRGGVGYGREGYGTYAGGGGGGGGGGEASWGGGYHGWGDQHQHQHPTPPHPQGHTQVQFEPQSYPARNQNNHQQGGAAREGFASGGVGRPQVQNRKKERREWPPPPTSYDEAMTCPRLEPFLTWAEGAVAGLSGEEAAGAICKVVSLVGREGAGGTKRVTSNPQGRNGLASLCKRVSAAAKAGNEVSGKGLAQVIWGIGKVLMNSKTGLPPTQYRALVEACAESLVRTEGGLSTVCDQSLANIAYGVAKASITSSARVDELLEAVEKEFTARNSSNFTSQHLANVAWGFAFLGKSSGSVMSVLESEIAKRDLSQWKMAELSMTMWACAKVRHESRVLYGMFANQMRDRRPETCTSQELANFCWALSEARYPVPDIFGDVVRTVCERRLIHTSPRDVRNILLCMARVHAPALAMCKPVADGLLANHEGDHVSIKQFVQAMWSFSHLRFSAEPRLIGMFEERLRRSNLKPYSSGDVAGALFSLAKLGGEEPEALNKVEEELLSRLTQGEGPPPYTPDEMAEAMWALAVLGRKEALAKLAGCFAREVEGHGGGIVLKNMGARRLICVVWSIGALESEETDSSSSAISELLNTRAIACAALEEALWKLKTPEELVELGSSLSPCRYSGDPVTVLRSRELQPLWQSFRTRSLGPTELPLREAFLALLRSLG